MLITDKVNIFNAILIGLKEIWAHKFRSVLTMLGIILGVSSLVAMSALVKGMEVGAREAMIAIGGLEKIRVEEDDVPPHQRHLRDQAVGVTLNDVYALQNSAPLVSRIVPEMRVRDVTMTRGKARFRPYIFSGAWPSILEMYEHTIAHGRMFNEIDDEMARNVCVIGTAVRDELFGSPEKAGEEIIPLGETIFINRQPFTIIGLFEHYESEQERREREVAAARGGQTTLTGPERSRGRGQRSSFVYRLKNATVYIPLNTMWLKFRSGMSDEQGEPVSDPRLTSLQIKISDAASFAPAVQQIRNVLMSTHRGIEDFELNTQEQWADSINEFVRNARMSGGIIAGISLLVGGIGIMNIMLASISGRVREIGVRKAIGARTLDVFAQILVESTIIAIIGGLMGLIASLGFVRVVGSLSTENAPIITAAPMLVAFSFSVCIGIAAGLFPAFKASRLDPIVALRYG